VWTLFFGALLVIAILAYLLLYQRNKRNLRVRPPSKRVEPHKVDPRASHAERHVTDSQSILELEDVIDDKGILIPEFKGTDQSDEFKKRIQEGIEFIFSTKPGMAVEQKKALRLEDVDPKVMKPVKEHISHLKDFRAKYQLYRGLDYAEINMSQLAKLIATDPILSGKILKIANSSYFGLQQKVNALGHALMIIGLINIKNILFQESLKELLNAKSPMKETMASLWEHATLVSICASHIHSLFAGLDRGTLLTMGLLHDIGRFVMISLEPFRQTGEAISKISAAQFNIPDEDEFFGINHALIGRLVFEEWRFSELMVRTVEVHHAPSAMEMDSIGVDGVSLKYLLVLFLADQVAKLFGNEERDIIPIAPLAHSYHDLVQEKKLLSLVFDGSLFSEIKKIKELMKGYM
jgi:HD-like signal output (HDOD) protein